MGKHHAAVLLLLLLSIQKSQCGFKCNKENEKDITSPIIIDCPPNATSNPNEFVCFAVQAEPLDTPGGVYVEQGCALKGICKDDVHWAQKSVKILQEDNCVECSEDKCNVLEFEVIEDGSTTTTAKTKTNAVSKISAISSVVITLIVVIVVFM